eukprot:gnl/TRDRNA2_/TRDRNA2_85894_c0_seq1.p1 gnl/TRDRNA2_/TRDRNA2_85894_c0~~gnl/TRDRNA2_/TRDRNA2_85894_c0_seq1.p1  ORF type:complete len:756 (-),score=147.77 gnl/TRDRNA2_/TRDRNA2_85894_c0_seq1:199-2466(-)
MTELPSLAGKSTLTGPAQQGLRGTYFAEQVSSDSYDLVSVSHVDQQHRPATGTGRAGEQAGRNAPGTSSGRSRRNFGLNDGKCTILPALASIDLLLQETSAEWLAEDSQFQDLVPQHKEQSDCRRQMRQERKQAQEERIRKSANRLARGERTTSTKRSQVAPTPSDLDIMANLTEPLGFFSEAQRQRAGADPPGSAASSTQGSPPRKMKRVRSFKNYTDLFRAGLAGTELQVMYHSLSGSSRTATPARPAVQIDRRKFEPLKLRPELEVEPVPENAVEAYFLAEEASRSHRQAKKSLRPLFKDDILSPSSELTDASEGSGAGLAPPKYGQQLTPRALSPYNSSADTPSQTSASPVEPKSPAIPHPVLSKSKTMAPLPSEPPSVSPAEPKPQAASHQVQEPKSPAASNQAPELNAAISEIVNASAENGAGDEPEEGVQGVPAEQDDEKDDVGKESFWSKIVEQVGPKSKMSTVRKEVFQCLRLFILGAVTDNKKANKDKVYLESCASKEKIGVVYGFWSRMDVDHSGCVSVNEFRLFAEKIITECRSDNRRPSAHANSAQQIKDGEFFKNMAFLQSGTPEENAKFVVRMCDRMQQIFQAKGKGSLVVEDLLRLMWPCSSIADLQKMKTWFKAFELSDGSERVKTPPVLPKAELDALAAVFKHFDKDGSGTVTIEELIHSGLIDREQAYRYVSEVDQDGNGEIDSSEFCELMCPNGYRANERAVHATTDGGQRIVYDQGISCWRMEIALDLARANFE